MWSEGLVTVFGGIVECYADCDGESELRMTRGRTSIVSSVMVLWKLL